MVPVIYSAYGLNCSADFEWPWCPPGRSERGTDLKISLTTLGEFAAYPSAQYRQHARRVSRDPTRQEPTVAVDRGDDGHYRVSYADGAQFVIDHSCSRVLGISRSNLTHDDLMVYLQGPIFGFLLRLRGVTCLHASAAAVDGRALAVVGHGGMGKSTSAATFAKLGFPVLTDDVLALRDNAESFHVQPGLPRVLLWPESVTALFGDANALPRLVSTWDKRYLDLSQRGFQFAQKRTPLGAIYILGDRLTQDSSTEISPLTGTAALLKLVANTYANDFLDAPMRAAELNVLSRLVKHVPIRLVQAPNDRASVPRVCEALIADFRSLA